MPDMEAYVHLLPGANEFGGNWKVKDLGSTDEDADFESLRTGKGAGGAFTDKHAREMAVPLPQLAHDWQVRAHEMVHAKRVEARLTKTCDGVTHGKPGHTCNVWRDMVMKMLEEVAVDAYSIAHDLFDLRSARNNYNYDTWPVPVDEFHAAMEYLQLWSTVKSPDPKAEPPLVNYLAKVEAVFDPAHLEAVSKAAENVWYDFREESVSMWADWLAAQFVPTRVPVEEPNVHVIKIDIQNVQSGEQSASGSESSEGSGSASGASASDSGEDEDDEADAEDESEEDDEAGEDGTAIGSAPEGGTALGLEGAPQANAQAGGEGATDGSSPRDVEATTPTPLSATDFNFDPLAAEHNMLDGEPIHPPEKDRIIKQRELITRAELQAEIDHEAAERRQGIGSQAEHLSYGTPYGNVDVHRHTFQRVTTKIVAAAWRSNDAGALVRYPQNLYSTQRIYGVKGRGGTILMDGSGSMSWHDDVVLTAMRSGELPNLTIARAYYHGYGWHNPRTKKPGSYICRLCITAQNGRYSMDDPREEPETTGANSGMDPAAMAFAAKYLPKPIVWISDGMVGEPFDHQCDAIMRQYRIARVIVLEDAVSYLKGEAVPGWWQCATVHTQFIRLGSPVMQSNERGGYGEARRWAQLRSQRRLA